MCDIVKRIEMDEKLYQSLARPHPGLELSYSSSSDEEDGTNLHHKHYREAHTRPDYEPDRRFTYNSHKVRRKPLEQPQKGKTSCLCVCAFICNIVTFVRGRCAHHNDKEVSAKD